MTGNGPGAAAVAVCMSDTKNRELRYAEDAESFMRRHAIDALRSLRELIDVSLAALDRDDGVAEVIDTVDLADACTAAKQMTRSHAEAHSQLARIRDQAR